MILLYKTLLGPALLWQGRRLRQSALRLPEANGPRCGIVSAGTGEVGAAAEDARADLGSGTSDTPTRQRATPLRLLVLGDSSAAGVGVDWQHQALAEPVARHLARATGRPVHWRLIARSGADTRDALALLLAQPAEPADVVVTALGVNDVTGQRSARAFAADVGTLLDRVAERTGARGAVLSGLPPLHRLPAAPQPLRWYLGQCASRLDAALRALCSARRHTAFVPLGWADPAQMARDRFHPGPAQYRAWAERVAQEALAVLASVANTDFATSP